MAKAFKVYNENKQSGVMASTLHELRKKIKKVFDIVEDVIPCLPDGTLIENEEYFQSLPYNERLSFMIVKLDDAWCETFLTEHFDNLIDYLRQQCVNCGDKI